MCSIAVSRCGNRVRELKGSRVPCVSRAPSTPEAVRCQVQWAEGERADEKRPGNVNAQKVPMLRRLFRPGKLDRDLGVRLLC